MRKDRPITYCCSTSKRSWSRENLVTQITKAWVDSCNCTLAWAIANHWPTMYNQILCAYTINTINRYIDIRFTYSIHTHEFIKFHSFLFSTALLRCSFRLLSLNFWGPRLLNLGHPIVWELATNTSPRSAHSPPNTSKRSGRGRDPRHSRSRNSGIVESKQRLALHTVLPATNQQRRHEERDHSRSRLCPFKSPTKTRQTQKKQRS